MIIGYARVSTDDQSLDSQTDALSAAGAEKVFADKISGSRRARPELDRMLEQLRDGPELRPWDLDEMAATPYDPTHFQRVLWIAPSVRRVMTDVTVWIADGGWRDPVG